MLAAADRPVAVVVDLDVLRSPNDADGEVGGEAQADGRAQALRPRLDGAERRPRPVHRPDQRPISPPPARKACGSASWLSGRTSVKSHRPCFESGSSVCLSVKRGCVGRSHPASGEGLVYRDAAAKAIACPLIAIAQVPGSSGAVSSGSAPVGDAPFSLPGFVPFHVPIQAAQQQLHCLKYLFGEPSTTCLPLVELAPCALSHCGHPR